MKDEDQELWIPLYMCSQTFIIDVEDHNLEVTDRTVLGYFPVLVGTPYSIEDFEISEKLAKRLFSAHNKAYINNCKVILDNDLIFKEHSLFLLIEHFKTVLKLSNDIEMLRNANLVLSKLMNIPFYEVKLERFLKAQNSSTYNKTTIYEQSIIELQSGYLNIHCWIRYIFPQMKGLGKSKVTEYYGLEGQKEASLYLKHPVLKERLIEVLEIILNNKRSVYEIFGCNVIRIRACCKLFAAVSDEPVFHKLIKKYMWN